MENKSEMGTWTHLNITPYKAQSGVIEEYTRVEMKYFVTVLQY